MEARQTKLLDFIKNAPQFAVPIYQRTYSWKEKQCEQLCADIIRAGQSDTVSAHFVGSVVYIKDGLYQVTYRPPLLVIDGQQRLTTTILILEALARAVKDTEPDEGFSALKIRNRYLSNPEETDDRWFKLILSQTDRSTLNAILKGHEIPVEKSIRIMENFEYFTSWMQKNKNSLATICKGLSKLIVVDVSLDREHDNPQLIFESMNSTGLDLSQADLIRNFILMGLKPDLQKKLYEKYWRPMEIDFGQEAYASQFDSFIRHYLTIKTRDIPNQKEVYETFKQYASEVEVETLVSDIRLFSKYFCSFALGKEADNELSLIFHDIREMKVEVCYPLLLEIYSDYVDNCLTKNEFMEICRLIESYVFRRAICELATNSMNKTFALFAKSLKKNNYLESTKATFLLLPSYRRFPGDEEFKHNLQQKDIYNFRNRMYLFRRLENFNRRKEPISVNEYEIEHIMPQNKNLSQEWKEELGADWKRIWEAYLHRLGNLTLTGYNKEYSDRPFRKKRDMENGFAQSPLRLNASLATLDRWNETEICNRAIGLADQSLQVWIYPNLSMEILESYKAPGTVPKYNLEDHPYLLTAPNNSIYSDLRRFILDIDPCVSEEFLKYYIAFKAETNFAIIVPQSKKLLLRLNIDLTEIEDPKQLCKDISMKGRWGNCDIETIVDQNSDFSYLMNLVRQAFERQFGTN